MNFRTAAHCVACGQVLGLEPVPEPEELTCPACSGSFVGIPTEASGRVLECEGCGSQFVDHTTLRALFERRIRLSYQIEAKSPVFARQPDRVRYLPCPICQDHMNRRNFGERSGVIVDVCRPHGIWFDPGELPRVMDFVARGGLEETARRELERERERLREERRANSAAFASIRFEAEPDQRDPMVRIIERVFRIMADMVRPD